MTSEEVPENTEATENTKATKWGTFWKIAGFPISGLAGFLITPYMQVGNDLKAHAIYACMAMTLYLFVLLLIYLEELSGFISKIPNAIKNFFLCVWEKINYVKKFFKPFCIFVGLTLLIAAELFLIHKTLEGFNNHATEIRNLPNEFNFSLKSDKLSKIQDIRFNTFLCAVGVLFLPTLPAAFFAKKIKSTLEKHILRTFVLTVIIGGILAFLIPTFLYNYGFIGDTKDLTTALLGVTGGAVALFSLIKSHQKSELEREQLEVQKQKDNREYIRQVHAARRDRYIEAVDKLSSEHAPVRLGGVYALIALIDEWLTETKNIRERECQVIINNLCAYIRSPFPLAAKAETFTEINMSQHPTPSKINRYIKANKSFSDNRIKFIEEKEIRQTIFKELSLRIANENNGPRKEFEPFIFNFEGSSIFYSLRGLNFLNANFSGSTFYGKADFFDASFFSTLEYETNFSDSTFTGSADFSIATFWGRTKFNRATFEKDADFNSCHFEKMRHSFDDKTFSGVTTITIGRSYIESPMYNYLLPLDSMPFYRDIDNSYTIVIAGMGAVTDENYAQHLIGLEISKALGY